MIKSEYNRQSIFWFNSMNLYVNYPVLGVNSIEPLDRMQPIRLDRRRILPIKGCLLAVVLIQVSLIFGAYFLAPIRMNLIVLGLDRAPEGTSLSRTDTMILTPLFPHGLMWGCSPFHGLMGGYTQCGAEPHQYGSLLC